MHAGEKETLSNILIFTQEGFVFSVFIMLASLSRSLSS